MGPKVELGDKRPVTSTATAAVPDKATSAAAAEAKPQSVRERFNPKQNLRERFGLPPKKSPAPAPAPAAAAAPSAPSTPLERHVAVPFFSQFAKGNGYEAGSHSCFAASTAMAKAVGAKVLPPNDRIQIAKSENKDGTIVADPAKAQAGIAYIDAQLDAGKPVVVGVSHKDADGNADNITDHFVVVTGRGKDAQGRTFYTFHDPATAFKEKGGDTNPNNRFYPEPQTGVLARDGERAQGLAILRRYEVSMVRKNA